MLLSHFLFWLGYSFESFDLGIIVSKMRQYISSHGGFRFVMVNQYFGASGRSDLPDVLLGVVIRCTISSILRCNASRNEDIVSATLFYRYSDTFIETVMKVLNRKPFAVLLS